MCDKDNLIYKKQRKLTDMLQKTNQNEALTKINTSCVIPTSLIAAANKISFQLPVSLKFFKAHTEYEEVIDRILRVSVKGDEDEYERMQNNEAIKENILLYYYRAFYVEPRIREEFPVKLKAMPKRLRDKLLQIPDENQSDKDDAVASDDSQLAAEEEEEKSVNAKQPMDALVGKIENKWNRNTKRSPISNNNTPYEWPPKSPKDKTIKSKSNSIVVKTTSIKDLQLYEHCCPITYKQFKDFTNVLSLMVEKFATAPKNKWPYFVKKTYLLFYLKPEVRLTSPFKYIKIKSDAACSKEIKEKFYVIPQLYIKNDEQCVVNLEQPKEKENCTIGESSLQRCYEIQEKFSSDQTDATKSLNDKRKKTSERKVLEILECRVLPPITFGEDNSKSSSRAGDPIAHIKPIQQKIINMNTNSNSNTQRETIHLLLTNEEENLEVATVNSHSDNLQRSIIVGEKRQQEKLLSPETNCVFCNFTLNDFITCTNVLQVLAKNFSNLSEMHREVRTFYIKFLTDRLEAEEMANITMSLSKVNVLKKYRHICLSCTNTYNLKILPSLNPIIVNPTNASKNSQENKIYDRFGGINENESQTDIIDIQRISLKNINEKVILSCATKENQVIYQTKDQHVEEAQLEVANEVGNEIMFDKNYLIVDVPAIKTISNVVNNGQQSFESHMNSLLPDFPSTDNRNECTEKDFETRKFFPKDNRRKQDNPNKFIKFIKYQLKAELKNLWKCIHYLPVDYETFKQWSEYEEPLRRIIKIAAGRNSKVAQMIQNDSELCELLLKKYYIRYFTSEEIRNKYPLKLKLCPSNIHANMLKYVKKQNGNEGLNEAEKAKEKQKLTEMDIYEEKFIMDKDIAQLKLSNAITMTGTQAKKFYSGIFCDEFLLNLIAIKYRDTLTQYDVLQLIKLHYPSLTQSSENVILEHEKLNNLSGKKKNENIKQREQPEDYGLTINRNHIHLPFSHLDKTYSLTYVLRTRHGLKHDIICHVLEMTFKEFHELVHIYQADYLKKDQRLMKYLYSYAIERNSSETKVNIWPIYLYIKVRDILDYLKKKNIYLPANEDKYILKYISPKFLHWIDLLQSTNFFSCVNNDFMKKNGIKLDLENKTLLHEAYKSYYIRCWKYDEWIWQTPVIEDQAVIGTSDDYVLTDTQKRHQRQSKVSAISSFSSLTSGQIKNNHGNNQDMVKVIPILNEQFSKSLTESAIVQNDTERNEELSKKNEGKENGNKDEHVIIIENMQEKVDEVVPSCDLDSNYFKEEAKNEERGEIHAERDVKEGRTKISSLSDVNLHHPNQLSHNKIESNYISVLNTQQQLEMLPDEISISQDPLLECDKRMSVLNNSICQYNEDRKNAVNENNEHYMNTRPVYVAIDDENDVNIKTEPRSMLNNLQFYLDDNDDIMHCAYLSEDVIVLDDSSMENNLDLIDTENVKSTVVIPTTTERMDINISTTLNHNYVKVANKDHPHNEIDAGKNISLIIVSKTDIQQIPQLIYSHKQNLNFNTTINKYQINEQQYQTQKSDKDTQNTGTNADDSKTINICRIVKPQQPLQPQISNTLHIEKEMVNVGVGKQVNSHIRLKKGQRSAALGKSGSFVPQLNHDFRSLPVQRVVKPKSCININSLANDNNNNSSQIANNLQPGSYRTTVSQELENDCTIFNNSSLIRIANYKNTEIQSTYIPTAKCEVERHYSKKNQSECTSNIPTSTVNQCPTKHQISSTTYCKTQIVPTNINTSNIVTSPKPLECSISSSCSEDTNNNGHTTKTILYRTLLQVDYFIKVTPQQIVRYSLDTTEVGNTFYQAVIRYDGLEICISKCVFSVLFPYWSTSLQEDILNLLKDLKEYHFSISTSHSSNIHQDLRVRILDLLFKTAPPISYICLSYDVSNFERIFCSQIRNEHYIPQTDLMGALKPKVLNKMRIKL